ncbi:MAG: undecaprenyldiphospho-muramoylpentapeptide beta-N-acetylglucosaminyltransferase [Alphaproteobacteria bacterium]
MKNNIIIAAGGTGGHLFPAMATAETLLKDGQQVTLICDKRANTYLQSINSNINRHILHATSPRGKSWNTITATVILTVGIIQALKLFITHRPRAVISFGGYGGVPTVLAAYILRIPIVLHEQNKTLGLANRVLAPLATRIAVSFPETLRIPPRAQSRTQLTGTPVRNSIAALASLPYPQPEPNGQLRLLILGGSQGASLFDTIIPQAIELLPQKIRDQLQITQQTRGNPEPLKRKYQNLGIHATLAPFFPDIDARLASTHLVISRAGASTIAELAIAARPAILIPYPHATNQHQKYNAQAFANHNCAQVILENNINPENLARAINAWLCAPARLANAATTLRENFQNTANAQSLLVRCTLEAINTKTKTTSSTNKEKLAL